jgi:chemotaxis protein histidine kinase CheA
VPDWTAAALSDQHVLLVAVSSDAAGTKVHYALLDSTYGTCLSTGSFTVGSGSLSGRLQLLPLSQHPFAPVALLVAGSVWLLPLQLPKANLAGLVANLGLGSAQAHAAAAAAAPEGTQLSLTARHQLNLSAIAAAVSTRGSPAGVQQQGPCVLQQLKAPAPAASAAAAGSAVTAAVQQVQQVLDKQKQPAQELESAVTQLCESLQQQQQQEGPTSVLVSQQLLARALTALCEAQQWSLLERLHSLAPLQSLAACADLVPSLAAAQQYSSMRAVLLSAQEVPAEAVVRAVQQVLQQQAAQQQGAEGPSEAQQASGQQIRAAAEAVVQQAEAAAAAGHADAAEQLVKAARHAAVAVDGFTSRELLLHVLLAVQVDGVEAQAALRVLPTAAVLRLLRYMVKWLHKYGRNNLTAPSTDPLLLTPAEPQLIEWCKLLLDAQLTKLMMMPAAAPLLQQLQHLLRSQAAATSKLLALKGVTDTWATGAPLPAAAVAANSQYVLELLDLRVKPRPAAGAKAQ